MSGGRCSEGRVSGLPPPSRLLFTAALSVDCCAETDGICARAAAAAAAERGQAAAAADVRENVKLVCDPKRPLRLLPSSWIGGEHSSSHFGLKTCQFTNL